MGQQVTDSKCTVGEIVKDNPYVRLMLVMNSVLEDDDCELVATELSSMSADDIINRSALQLRIR